jgi:hypothetical protein
MMMSDDKVGGWVKKGQNHDDVILECPLVKLETNMIFFKAFQIFYLEFGNQNVTSKKILTLLTWVYVLAYDCHFQLRLFQLDLIPSH